MIYALTPTMTGWPLYAAVVAWLPAVLAITVVLPLLLGLGDIGRVITISVFVISTFMALLLNELVLLFTSSKIPLQL